MMTDFNSLSETEKNGVANLIKIVGYTQEQAILFVKNGRKLPVSSEDDLEEMPKSLTDRWDNDVLNIRILA